MPGVKIGLREHFFKKISRPIHFLISPMPYATRTLATQKKKFQKFWTLDSRNGAKVTSATTLDDLYKEDSRISPLFLRYWQIHEKITKIIVRLTRGRKKGRKKELKQTRKILKKVIFFQRKILRISTIFSNFKQNKQFSKKNSENFQGFY